MAEQALSKTYLPSFKRLSKQIRLIATAMRDSSKEAGLRWSSVLCDKPGWFTYIVSLA
jgi:hypothetical protein